jgi:hypothetical protein
MRWTMHNWLYCDPILHHRKWCEGAAAKEPTELFTKNTGLC